MIYENELCFLCNALEKCHIKSIFLNHEDTFDTVFGDSIRALYGDMDYERREINDFLKTIKPFTVYKLETNIKLCYLILILPQRTQECILVLGPYLSGQIDARILLELGEKRGVAPQKQKMLEEYYDGIPVLPDNSAVFAVLDTFCEHIWGGSDAFSVIDVKNELKTVSGITKNSTGNVKDVLVNMEIMEKRYAFENELMRAVSKGQEHKFVPIMSEFSSALFEKRLSDPLRNLKNYNIIMNTLLRKAAENGGVHPLYLNDISSSFAVRIEQLPSVAAVPELMSEMFRSYCRLVRKHSTKQYSSTVQKAITVIDSDLSANLSLSSIAALQNISSGYLSTIFKKETGKTITEYIMGERMNLARHLLATTHLQIQTVALHCGIMDVQYFSKVFKKYIGKTPKEYRESAKAV